MQLEGGASTQLTAPPPLLPPRLPHQQHVCIHQQRLQPQLLSAPGFLQPERSARRTRGRRRRHHLGGGAGRTGHSPGQNPTPILKSCMSAPLVALHPPSVPSHQMKEGRRTSSLKASYEAIKNNDFQLGREFSVSRDGSYSSSALASTLTQTLTPSTTSDSRGRKSK